MNNPKQTSSTSTIEFVIQGDLLSTNVDRWNKEIKSLIDQSGQAWSILKLDMSSAKMIDSSGLNLLVSIVKKVQAMNKKVETVIRSPHVHRTFIFTRLDQQVHVTLVQ